MRDLCVRLGSDCLDVCLKGVYKAYVLNCKLSKSISRSKLQHIQFLGNCVAELYGINPLAAYQHIFMYIRQLAVVLRGALTEKGTKVINAYFTSFILSIIVLTDYLCFAFNSSNAPFEGSEREKSTRKHKEASSG